MYLDDAVQTTAGFEGRIHWMYLDTAGVVTVGVGQAIPTPESALAYPFQRPNAEFASREEILAEYALVKGMLRGNVAKAYRRSTSLLLSDEAIDRTLRNTIATCVAELGQTFPQFHAFPDPARVALIDMAFNLGITKLRRNYPIFCKLVQQQEWAAASSHCHRIGPSEARNVWTKEQFLSAGVIATEVTENAS